MAQAQNRERAVLLGAGVLLAGMLALLGLHAVERVRSSRRGQRVAEALAEELAVALPDGLVVFDAKGRITRMNKAALTLLGMEAPAKGKAFLGRKPAEVLPSALAELAAKLLQEPVLPDTEIILRHGEEQQYISVRGGHVNEGYEGRLGSLMFLRDLTEVRRLEAEVRRREKLAAVGNLAAGVAHEPVSYTHLKVILLLTETVSSSFLCSAPSPPPGRCSFVRGGKIGEGKRGLSGARDVYKRQECGRAKAP